MTAKRNKPVLVSPERHQKLKEQAAVEGVTVTELVEKKLDMASGVNVKGE